MARVYRVASDMSEKEKAVGGLLTFGQAGWVVCGLVVGAAVFVGLANFMPPMLALFISLIPAGGIAIPIRLLQQGRPLAGAVSGMARPVPKEEQVSGQYADVPDGPGGRLRPGAAHEGS